MSRFPELSKLYGRSPTNEDIERDFHSSLFDAWLGVTNLYDYLKVLYKDGLLSSPCPSTSAERLLKDLKEVKDRLDTKECDWELDLVLPAEPELPKELTDLLQAKA